MKQTRERGKEARLYGRLVQRQGGLSWLFPECWRASELTCGRWLVRELPSGADGRACRWAEGGMEISGVASGSARERQMQRLAGVCRCRGCMKR